MIKSKIFEESFVGLLFSNFKFCLQLHFIEFKIHNRKNICLGIKLQFFSLFLDLSSCNSKLRLSWIDYTFISQDWVIISSTKTAAEVGLSFIELEKVIAWH
jgi:hypothetical protein